MAKDEPINFKQVLHVTFVKKHPTLELMLVMALVLDQPKESIMEVVEKKAPKGSPQYKVIADEIDYLIEAPLDTLLSDLEAIEHG